MEVRTPLMLMLGERWEKYGRAVRVYLLRLSYTCCRTTRLAYVQYYFRQNIRPVLVRLHNAV